MKTESEISKQASLAIEVGKYYRTRDGRKAYVGHIAPKEFGVYRDSIVSGYAQTDDYWASCTWSMSGAIVTGCDSDLDLIAEWTEPKKYRAYFMFDEDCSLCDFEIYEITKKGDTYFEVLHASDDFVSNRGKTKRTIQIDLPDAKND